MDHAIEAHGDVVTEAEPIGQDEHAAMRAPRYGCPCCASEHGLETLSRDTLTCRECDVRFPIIQCGKIRIPWLFPKPDAAWLEWKARYNGFLQSNSAEQERLRKALGDARNSRTGRRRISRLLKARKQYRRQVAEIIAPLGLEHIDWPPDVSDRLHNKLPRNQGLSSYYNNVFRDWAWNNGESEALFEAIDEVMCADTRQNVGAVLTLGAGACRLPYDIHRHYSPDLSVALDLNPFLLQVGSRVIQGDDISLFEFPVAPINEAAFAVLQDCRAPFALDLHEHGSFRFVLGDAMSLPFAKGSFDTIVTPWLIDIIPQDLRNFVPRINRTLVKDGVWANTGSLAFFHRDASWCYSEEEVVEIIEESGFEILSIDRRTVRYLQSPISAHGRTERIFSFSARKLRDVEMPKQHSYLPDWILDTSQPIPSLAEIIVASSSHLLTAQVLAAIDGKRTINQIGHLIATEYDLGMPEAIHAVKRILIDAHEDTTAAGSAWTK